MLALRRISSRVSPRAFVRFNSSSDGSAGTYRGEQSGDAFTKREKAHEDLYVKQQEKESLKRLRAEIEKREKDLVDLKAQEKDLQK